MLSIEPVGNRVAILRMHNGKFNTLTAKFENRLVKAFEDLENDPQIDCVILTSGVAAYSAGLDLGVFTMGNRKQITDMMSGLNRLVLKMHTTSLSIIAAINGKAPAGGTVLALGCDYRIACRNPSIGKPKYVMALNETQVNLSGTMWLHLHCENVTGRRNADRILSTGKTWTTEEALKLGLVDEVVDESELISRALAMAKEYVNTGQEARAFFRRNLRAPVISFMKENFEKDVQFCTEGVIGLRNRPGVLNNLRKKALKKKQKMSKL